MDLKKPLTFDEQLDKLIVHGMIVADREKAKDILKRVNYYRFTGYALQFRKRCYRSYGWCWKGYIRKSSSLFVGITK